MHGKKQMNDSSSINASRRHALQGLATMGMGAAALPLATRKAAAEAPLTVYAWEGYEYPELHPSFFDEYGDSPNFSLYVSVEEAFGKLRAGYKPDVGIAGLESLVDWREAGYLAPIDTSRTPNATNLFEKFRTTEGAVDADGTQWALPFAWGTASVIYRTDIATDYIGRNTWDILWDPQYAGRISNVDSGTQVATQAALLLGIDDPFNMDDDDLARVREKMIEQRPLVRDYWNDFASLQQSIATGEVVAAYGFSDSYFALLDEGVPVSYMNPDEGILAWIDFLVMMSEGSAPLDMRYDYMESALSPQSGAFLIEDYGWGSANKKAYELADLTGVASLGMDDPEKIIESATVLSPMPPETTTKIATMFEEMKAGF